MAGAPATKMFKLPDGSKAKIDHWFHDSNHKRVVEAAVKIVPGSGLVDLQHAVARAVQTPTARILLPQRHQHFQRMGHVSRAYPQNRTANRSVHQRQPQMYQHRLQQSVQQQQQQQQQQQVKKRAHLRNPPPARVAIPVANIVQMHRSMQRNMPQRSSIGKSQPASQGTNYLRLSTSESVMTIGPPESNNNSKEKSSFITIDATTEDSKRSVTSSSRKRAFPVNASNPSLFPAPMSNLKTMQRQSEGTSSSSVPISTSKAPQAKLDTDGIFSSTSSNPPPAPLMAFNKKNDNIIDHITKTKTSGIGLSSRIGDLSSSLSSSAEAKKNSLETPSRYIQLEVQKDNKMDTAKIFRKTSRGEGMLLTTPLHPIVGAQRGQGEGSEEIHTTEALNEVLRLRRKKEVIFDSPVPLTNKAYGELKKAVCEGDVKQLKMLATDSKANLNSCDVEGNSVLLWATFYGRANCVLSLLEQRADLHHRNSSGTTPVICAADAGHLDCLEVLIKKRADISSSDRNGMTPLMWAAEKGNLACAKRLLSARAISNVTDRDGFSPLHLSAAKGHAEVLKRFLEARSDVNSCNNGGASALVLASFGGHSSCVERLLKAQADVHQSSSGSTALHCAAQKGFVACVSLLTKSGASVNLRNKIGWTPTMLAACHGHLDCLKELVKAKADIDKQDTYGRTALTWAMYKDRRECMKFLKALSAFGDNNVQRIEIV